MYKLFSVFEAGIYRVKIRNNAVKVIEKGQKIM